MIITLISLTISNPILKDEDGILILEEQTFARALMEYDYLLIEFYTHWCHRCKNFHSEYAKVARNIKKANLGIAKFDVTEAQSLASTYKINSYPSLKLFYQSSSYEYKGEKTMKDIIRWIKKKMATVTIFSKFSELEQFIKDNEISVVYFGTNKVEIDLIKEIAKVESIIFGISSNEEGYVKYKIKEGTLVLFKYFGIETKTINKKLTEQNIREFIKLNSNPLVMKVNSKSIQFVLDKKIPALILYRDRNSENTPPLDEIMKSVSEKIYNRIQVFISDITQDDEKKVADYLGIKPKDLPVICLYDTKKKYFFKNAITEPNVMQFIKQWEEGKAKAIFKSQDVPKDQLRPVYVLVGDTFKDIVLKSNKDVLVKFYAPWCKHCIELAPIFEQLAIILKNNENLIIAEVDSTENEIEEVTITGYPTIKFWAAGKKNTPIEYTGGKTIKDFIKFISNHATYTITLPKDDL